MSNIFEYLQANAELVYRDRSDIFEDVDEAYKMLLHFYEILSGMSEEDLGIIDGDGIGRASVSSAGFELCRTIEPGIDEYSLKREISDYTVFPEEFQTTVYDWLENSQAINFKFPEGFSTEFDDESLDDLDDDDDESTY